MNDGIMITIGDDGVARMYDDTYDITIHCESEEEHNEVLKILRGLQWIPCSERLPEDDTVVLVCGKNGGVYTAIHNNSKTWIRGWWKMNSKNHHCNPTAWMPLPAPYKGEDDETD